MKVDSGRINAVIRLTTTNIVKEIARTSGVTPEDAYRRFWKTKTCALLQDPKSKLYTESLEYVWDMLESEMRGDWSKWLEI